MGNSPSLVGWEKLIENWLFVGAMEVIVGSDGTDTPPLSVIIQFFFIKFERSFPAIEIVYLLKPPSKVR